MQIFDVDELKKLFIYDPQAPMIFSSGFFLFIFAAFLTIYVALRRAKDLRIIYVILFSYYFYYKSSGIYFLALLFVTLCDFFLALQMKKSNSSRTRKTLVAISVSVNLALLCYFKYTNFFYEIYSNLTQNNFDPFDIFLPVGVSFFTFQSMSYTIDVYRRKLKPLRRIQDYAFYVSFFPQLVAGPIVRAKDFIPQIRKPIFVSQQMFERGVFLIITGLFKKAIISDYISINFVDRIFDNPALYSGIENLFGIYGYALQIYCDFSGYSDMAIGIALLLGFRFNINFDSPYKSASITEFWRRWHISLSSWLRDYLYIPLGGNRISRVRTYINLALTMILGGLWHGASLRFLCWGALHGIALAMHKLLMTIFPILRPSGDQMHPISRILGTIFTFHLVCLSWIFFRAENFELAISMITQIITFFHAELLFELIKAYPAVFFLLILGYALHFAPAKIEQQCQQYLSRQHLIWKAIALALVITLVMQIKSSEIQAFIYFQF